MVGVLVAGLLGSSGCERPRPSAASIDALAREIARRASSGDRAYFHGAYTPLEADGDQSERLLARLRKCRIAETYRSRLQVSSPTLATISYHEPAHLQIVLEKRGERWYLRQIADCL
jgi:hypothetical protein